MAKRDDLFWSAPIDALKRGLIYDEQCAAHICLLCSERFEEGTIYPQGGALHTAAKAAAHHVKAAHGEMFQYLLTMNREYTGLTERQAQLMNMLYQGLSDKQIIEQVSASSTSTVRNQRFALREKYKQAKIIVAMMELLDEHAKEAKTMEPTNKGDQLAQIHRTASMIDERYAITEAEKSAVLNRYFDAEGNLLIDTFPAREKRKVIILQYIAEQFEYNRQYTEKEVNEVILRYYDDIATVRRYLIEYGFMDRKSDCSAYWLK